MRRVVVIGGGIAGLATALGVQDRARAAGLEVEVLLLEAGDQVGGNIRTDRDDGWTVEWGPNGFLDSVPATLDLVRRVGLEGRIQRADANAAKRYIYRSGKLRLLPAGPVGFFASPVLSVPGRLRVMWEPFARSRPEGVDETIHDFAARRIGEEAASVLVDAMVSGVFAGNTRELSLKSTFPTMARMEAEHGGLVRAMIAKQKARGAAKQRGGPSGPAGTLTSFDDGLDLFPRAVERALGQSVRTRAPVVSLQPVAWRGEERRTGPVRWAVRLGTGETVLAEQVVLAVPAATAAKLLEPLDSELGETLSSIRSATIGVVALGYDAAAIGGAPDGFGFLVPRGEGPRILGCLWDSSLFPGRAPDGKVLLRAMIGGAHDPQATELERGGLVEIVTRDLATTMGISAKPELVRVYRHKVGIAQYHVGHAERLASIEEGLARLPGLSVSGSSYFGVAMNACIERAAQDAERIVDSLAAGGESAAVTSGEPAVVGHA
jgi:oxygen-dependent protoporphyrinogen oxidase